MDVEEFHSQLRSACADAIDAYRTQFPDAPPLTEHRLGDRDGPLASEAAIHARFAALTRTYDDMFDVDSTPYRETWRDHLVYDCSRRERLGLLMCDLPASLTLMDMRARYAPETGHIGVSPWRLPESTASWHLASELCHAYQHRFDSPTWSHQYLREGFEQAASIRAQAYLASELDDTAVTHLATRQRAKALLQGVLAHGTRRGGITPTAVRTLGLTDAELSDLRAHSLRRPLGNLRPRFRWSSIAFLPEYALFGSLLLVSDAAGVTDTYARAFRGEHPWEAIVAEIRAITPGWLWRLYNS